MALYGVALDIQYVALDGAGQPVSADGPNHTLYLNGAPVSCSGELGGGAYYYSASAAEMQVPMATLTGYSASTGVILIPVQIVTEQGRLAVPNTSGSVADEVEARVLATPGQPLATDENGNALSLPQTIDAGVLTNEALVEIAGYILSDPSVLLQVDSGGHALVNVYYWYDADASTIDLASLAQGIADLAQAVADLQTHGDESWTTADLTALNDAVAAVAQAVVDLQTHGDESWTTADLSAVADALAALGQAITDLQAHGDETWATADVSALSDAVAAVAQAVADVQTHGDEAWATADLSALGSALEELAEAIAAVKAKTDRLGAAQIQYTGPAGSNGSFRIIAGDDYTATQALTFTITDYAGRDLAGATCVLRLLDVESFAVASADGEVPAAQEANAAIAVDGATVTLTAELTGQQTAGLLPHPPADQRQYVHQFRATWTDGGQTTTSTIGEGRTTVRRGLSAPAAPLEAGQ